MPEAPALPPLSIDETARVRLAGRLRHGETLHWAGMVRRYTNAQIIAIYAIMVVVGALVVIPGILDVPPEVLDGRRGATMRETAWIYGPLIFGTLIVVTASRPWQLKAAALTDAGFVTEWYDRTQRKQDPDKLCWIDIRPHANGDRLTFHPKEFSIWRWRVTRPASNLYRVRNAETVAAAAAALFGWATIRVDGGKRTVLYEPFRVRPETSGPSS